MLIALCVGVPLFVLGLAVYLRSQYGNELFGLSWPGHDLNRPDDYRLIKLRLQDPPQSEKD